MGTGCHLPSVWWGKCKEDFPTLTDPVTMHFYTCDMNLVDLKVDGVILKRWREMWQGFSLNKEYLYPINFRLTHGKNNVIDLISYYILVYEK